MTKESHFKSKYISYKVRTVWLYNLTVKELGSLSDGYLKHLTVEVISHSTTEVNHGGWQRFKKWPRAVYHDFKFLVEVEW